MGAIAITGGRVLTAEGFRAADLGIEDGLIAAIGPDAGRAPAAEDATGLLVLPGIVDLHGDAFERQILPRPRTAFPLDVALAETDRQLVANGVTTAFHGITVSWEPGLRSLDTAREIVTTLDRIAGTLRADTRLHIRWETFALDAAEEVGGWLSRTPPPVLAFNDHTTSAMENGPAARKLATMAERTGLSLDAYEALQAAVWERRAEVPAAIARLAAAARAAGAILLAHDERTPEERAAFRALGAHACEFPMNPETAAAARAAGEHVVLGAPNVVRGGSHNGMMGASAAVADGLCTVLASDYYYPAPLLAAFRLAADGVLPLEAAWRLVSTNAAEAAGLADRGRLAPGLRADLLLVDAADPLRPAVVATYAGGRRVFSTR